jgi:hypothetical protein
VDAGAFWELSLKLTNSLFFIDNIYSIFMAHSWYYKVDIISILLIYFYGTEPSFCPFWANCSRVVAWGQQSAKLLGVLSTAS